MKTILALTFATVQAVGLSAQSVSLGERSNHPSFGGVVLSTATVGAAVGAASGLALYLASGGGAEDEGLDEVGAGMLAGIGLAVGYPIGSGWAAARAARVPAGKPILMSFFGAALGGAAWYWIDSAGRSQTLGAVTAFTTHVTVTSLYAYRKGVAAASMGARMVVVPTRDRRLLLGYRLPLR